MENQCLCMAVLLCFHFPLPINFYFCTWKNLKVLLYLSAHRIFQAFCYSNTHKSANFLSPWGCLPIPGFAHSLVPRQNNVFPLVYLSSHPLICPSCFSNLADVWSCIDNNALTGLTTARKHTRTQDWLPTSTSRTLKVRQSVAVFSNSLARKNTSAKPSKTHTL